MAGGANTMTPEARLRARALAHATFARRQPLLCVHDIDGIHSEWCNRLQQPRRPMCSGSGWCGTPISRPLANGMYSPYFIACGVDARLCVECYDRTRDAQRRYPAGPWPFQRTPTAEAAKEPTHG